MTRQTTKGVRTSYMTHSKGVRTSQVTRGV